MTQENRKENVEGGGGTLGAPQEHLRVANEKDPHVLQCADQCVLCLRLCRCRNGVGTNRGPESKDHSNASRGKDNSKGRHRGRGQGKHMASGAEARAMGMGENRDHGG